MEKAHDTANLSDIFEIEDIRHDVNAVRNRNPNSGQDCLKFTSYSVKQ